MRKDLTCWESAHQSEFFRFQICTSFSIGYQKNIMLTSFTIYQRFVTKTQKKLLFCLLFVNIIGGRCITKTKSCFFLVDVICHLSVCVFVYLKVYLITCGQVWVSNIKSLPHQERMKLLTGQYHLIEARMQT